MSSTWIQMPVENAKEVVERFITEGFESLGINGGPNFNQYSIISYESDCEVYLPNEVLMNVRATDNYIYFGYLTLATNNSAEGGLKLFLDSGNDAFYAIDCTTASMNTVTIPVMFNVADGTLGHNCAFIGYKFKVTNP